MEKINKKNDLKNFPDFQLLNFKKLKTQWINKKFT